MKNHTFFPDTSVEICNLFCEKYFVLCIVTKVQPPYSLNFKPCIIAHQNQCCMAQFFDPTMYCHALPFQLPPQLLEAVHQAEKYIHWKLHFIKEDTVIIEIIDSYYPLYYP